MHFLLFHFVAVTFSFPVYSIVKANNTPPGKSLSTFFDRLATDVETPIPTSSSKVESLLGPVKNPQKLLPPSKSKPSERTRISNYIIAGLALAAMGIFQTLFSLIYPDGITESTKEEIDAPDNSK